MPGQICWSRGAPVLVARKNTVCSLFIGVPHISRTLSAGRSSALKVRYKGPFQGLGKVSGRPKLLLSRSLRCAHVFTAGVPHLSEFPISLVLGARGDLPRSKYEYDLFYKALSRVLGK